jgi:hypothetical protein
LMTSFPPARVLSARPARAGRAARPRAPLSEDAAAMACLSLIVVAYLATGLATGIWWIPWALLAVPAFRLMRRSRSGWASALAGQSLLNVVERDR